MVSKFVKACAGAILLACTLTAIPAGASRDVRYANGEIELAGELMLPETGGPYSAVIIAQGSGDSDRTNQWSRDIAAIFLDSGIAVLLTDKRGSGASGGDWETSSMEDLTDDAVAAAAFLRTIPEIAPDRIGIAGLSQGGKYVPLVAVADGRIAFAISMSGDAVSFGEQLLHEFANDLRQQGLREPMIEAATPLLVAAARYTMNGNWTPYAAMRAAAESQPWSPVLQGFPADPEDPRWIFWRETARFDPMVYWPFVTQPVLVLLGEDDEQDNVAVAETVHRLEFGFAQARKNNFRIVVVPGAGHDAGVYSAPQTTRAAIRDFLDQNGLCSCGEEGIE